MAPARYNTLCYRATKDGCTQTHVKMKLPRWDETPHKDELAGAASNRPSRLGGDRLDVSTSLLLCQPRSRNGHMYGSLFKFTKKTVKKGGQKMVKIKRRTLSRLRGAGREMKLFNTPPEY